MKYFTKSLIFIVICGAYLRWSVLLAGEVGNQNPESSPVNLKYLLECGNPIVFNSLCSIKLMVSDWMVLFQSVSSSGTPVDLTGTLSTMNSCKSSDIFKMLGIKSNCVADESSGLTITEFMVYSEATKGQCVDLSSLQSMSSSVVNNLSTPFELFWEAYEQSVQLTSNCQAVEASIQSIEVCNSGLEEAVKLSEANFNTEMVKTAQFVESIEKILSGPLLEKVESMSKEAVKFGMAMVDKKMETYNKGKSCKRGYYPKGKNKSTEV
nr:hypothetical protein [Donax vittatus]